MEKLLGLGVLGMIAACVTVGVRLLLLTRRTRQAPELLLGLSFLLMGGVGYPLAIAARAGGGSATLLTIALAAQDVACMAMYAAAWRTFRSQDAWGAWVCAAAGVGFAASVGLALSTGDPNSGGGYYLGLGVRAGAFAWMAGESYRYAGLLARRLQLGLVDPVLANRFRLWTISSGGVLLGFGVFLVGRLTTDGVATAPWVLATTSLISLVSATSMWLAFVPPAAYLRRLRA